MRFLLEALDPSTECPRYTSVVDISEEDVAEVAAMIDATPADLLDGAQFDLRTEEVRRLDARFGLQLDARSIPVRLRRAAAVDELPYPAHTGRELDLMLRGTKPLACFTGRYPVNPDVEEIPERLFDPYVAAGKFAKRECVVPLDCPVTDHHGPVRGTRMVLYALPHQRWRIEAMLYLLDAGAKSGWSEGMERLQGMLLGYENWQNDIFIERLFRKRSQ